MQLSIAKDDGQSVQIAVTGRVTQSDFGPIHEPLAQLLGPNAYARKIRLDLSDTNYLDSSGVGWLLTCHKNFQTSGGKLLLHSVPPMVDQVLRLLQLHHLLTIKTDRAAALAAVSAMKGKA